jgi:S-DNA-T family DNA segregation ATPase FtsK/SpoIIIE
MGAPAKRRSTTRRRTQKSAKVVLTTRAAPRLWVRELATVALLVGALFLFLALGSRFFFSGPSASRNLMGPLGHVIATVMSGALGVCAFIPAVWLLWLAFFRPHARLLGAPAPRYGPFPTAVAWAGLLFSALLLGALAFGVEASGSLGAWLGSGARRNFGLGGTLLGSVVVAGLSVGVLLQRSIGDLTSAVRFGVVRGALFVLRDLPLVIGRLGAALVCTTGRAFANVGRALVRMVLMQREVSAPPEPDLPKPVLRKNIMKSVPKESPVDEPEPASSQRADPLIVKPKAAAAYREKKSANASAKKKASEQVEAVVSTNPFHDYRMPDVALLVAEEGSDDGESDEELRQKAEQIESKLRDFNIAGRVTQVHPGPVITLFEFEPAAGVKVGRIAALQDDLAMSLRATSIRIIAPIPKRGTVGIEVPNKHRNIVRLRDCLESEAFASADSILSVPLGKDTYGDAIVVDIATMPHLLMAGATGTGKSVCINALLLSLLYRAHPADLGLILIDPKVLELSIYEGIPHLRVPVVTDPRQAKAVLSWAVKEMDRRYRYMQQFNVRNIDGYNRIVSGQEAPPEDRGSPVAGVVELSESDVISSGTVDPGLSDGDDDVTVARPMAAEQLKVLPKIVIVIDELADLMLTVGREIEELITRLAQKARAAGIHLIVATQRPSVDVITGLIKANFPARLSFRVSSRIDSRTILDSMGAEKLLGKGDMLFLQPGAVPLRRIHGAFVSDAEVARVVGSLKSACEPEYDAAIVSACERALKEEGSGNTGEGADGTAEDLEYDPFYDKAVELVVEKGHASTSMVQRAFRIGYNRAARIIEVMEREGIVGPMDGVKPREVIAPPVTGEQGE